MIKTSYKEGKSVIGKNPLKEYFIPSDNCTNLILSLQSCEDCEMSRISMSCYAATKHQYSEKENKIARLKPKDKPMERKYAEIEAPKLDKYNGKLMNSIWGLYNRNSPHNFKSLNTESQLFVSPVEQGRAATFKKASFVQFTVPSFTGIVTAGFETKIEVNKPETTLEKLENIFNSPPFF